jgi:hydrogenase large subunit
VEILAKAYSDYFTIGTNRTNLLSYGMFRKPGLRDQTYYPAGAVIEGRREDVVEDAITEEEAAFPKGQPDWLKHSYGWAKVPRYKGEPMQGGPIARLWLSGDYRRGTATMDRIYTRVLETKKIAEWSFDWLKALRPGEPGYKAPAVKAYASGRGMHDSMRGPLGHWLSIERYRIERYRVITPSTWNMAPRGTDGKPGLIEAALIGSPVEDPENPVEVGRIVRSFDPCSACAVHIVDADRNLGEYQV